MRKVHKMHDPIDNCAYAYETRDDKEEKLLDALRMSLKEECPPDQKDYVCMADETEMQMCDECWLRWATKDFKSGNR